MNKQSKNLICKTVIATLFTFASVLAFAADVAVNASTGNSARTSAGVDGSHIRAESNSDSNANANASVDEQAAAQSAESNSRESVGETVELSNTVQSAVEQTDSSILESATEVEGAVSIEENAALVVETVDGVAIDLATETATEVSGAINSSVESSLADSEQTIHSVSDATVETGVEILGNTGDTASDIAESVEAGTDISSETDAMADASSDFPELEDQQADVESVTNNQTSGGLGLL